MRPVPRLGVRQFMRELPGAAGPALLVPDSALYGAAWRLRDTPTWMPRDKVEVARQAVDAYNRRDVDDLFAELATPDFEYYPAITRALDGGGGYRGREGVEKFAADTREN